MSSAVPESYSIVKNICLERRSVRKYLDKEIPQGVLEDILTATQSVPTSINAQPYKILVVRSKEDKEKLAETMLLGNERFVKTAAATVLFLYDKQPYKLQSEYCELQRAAGHSDAGVKGHAKMLNNIAPSNCIMKLFIRTHMWITGLYSNVIRRGPADAWSDSNTSYAVMQFCILCQAAGLGNIILGGYDSNRINKKFNIPSRYGVSVAVVVGYEDKTEQYKPSLRYKPDIYIYIKLFKKKIIINLLSSIHNNIIYEGKFGQHFSTTLPLLQGKQTWSL
ncbi:hypothetical protein WA158_000414 [Blastocystis sp. Blastoise]